MTNELLLLLVFVFTFMAVVNNFKVFFGEKKESKIKQLGAIVISTVAVVLIFAVALGIELSIATHIFYVLLCCRLFVPASVQMSAYLFLSILDIERRIL